MVAPKLSALTRSPIVLGSRSPRRRDLLSQLVPQERIVVRPPSSSDEAGFNGLASWAEIETRLFEIVRVKNEDVRAHSDPAAAVLSADTVIVGEAEGELAVLGQPPADESWREVVRDWFHRYLLGRPHFAVTGVCLSVGERNWECVVRTKVVFTLAEPAMVDWYLDTGEPVGKAGGYGLQGAGSVFVEMIDGSPSNVIGLPLRETRNMLIDAGLLDGPTMA